MALVTQSINITYAGTSSVVFNRPVQQITLLDSSNINYLRQVMVSGDGIKVIRQNYAIQIPMSELFAAAFAAYPSMSWAPVIATDVTGSLTVMPNTISLATASMTFGVTDEFNDDITYQWYVSSSYNTGWQLPTASVWVKYQNTSSANMSASFSQSSAAGLWPYYYYCKATNPAGLVTSSICTVTGSLP